MAVIFHSTLNYPLSSSNIKLKEKLGVEYQKYPFINLKLGLYRGLIAPTKGADMTNRNPTTPLLFILLFLALCGGARAAALDRAIQDEVFYFVLPDRFYNADSTNDAGGYKGDKFSHGFDPTDKAFYHGGDLKGLTAKLDYLKGLGVTAIWMGPIFKNKPVQNDANGISAGYHGYWVTDFTQVDPHLGVNADLKELIEKAHAKGIKVFFDIITNHTADVIQYRECHDPGYTGPHKAGSGEDCVYRTKAEYPYTTQGGPDGPPINPGFLGDRVQTEENFAKLTDPRWAYTPYAPEAEKNLKSPAWLNDLIYYHNRGESTYSGENSEYGDFVSLDDLFTEHPRVVRGMIDIYQDWIQKFKVDGFRVDTVKHVNIEFWQQFVPAITRYAQAQGIPGFFVFGEVYDPTPELLSRYTTEGQLPAVLDFGFQGMAASFVTTPKPTDDLKEFFAKDDYYIDADSDAYTLPTFIGNHDMGRIGHFIQQAAGSTASREEQLQRSRLAHALMYFARGVPVIYYGDEQGFTGDGKDQDARENMFPSQVTSYNDNVLLGADATTARDHFDTGHPLYQTLKRYGEIYQAHQPLRRGVQIHRYSDNAPGIYAFSRIDPASGQEYVLAFNNDARTRSATFKTWATGGFTPIHPVNGKPVTASETLTVEAPALDFVILKADQPIPRSEAAPAVSFVNPADNSVLIEDQFVTVKLSDDKLADVTFAAKIGDGEFEPLGRDANPPYRVFFKLGNHANGTPVTFRATAGDYAGHTQTAQVKTRIDTRLPHVTVHYQNSNGRDSVYAIFSTGEMIFPRPLADNRFEFDWPTGADGVTLIFEKRDGQHFAFDEPVYLGLTETVMPQARDKNGRLTATLQIDARPALSADLAPQPPLTETVHVRGGMNGWKATDPLDYIGRHTYHRRLDRLDADSIDFKFADANWQTLNVGAPVRAHGANRSSNPGNLRIRPEGESGPYNVWFFAFPKGEGYYLFYRFEPAKQD